ncbi:MAG TPA: dodecin [Oceanipulchritudo sp.]|nr:dodecin [Oceanipulchritudo sp.]
MSDHVYKKVEVVGSSKESLEIAISNAVERASQSLHNLRWFEVQEIRGHIVEGKVDHWQVGVKIGFTLDDSTGAP